MIMSEYSFWVNCVRPKALYMLPLIFLIFYMLRFLNLFPPCSFDPSLSIEERQKRISQDARKAMFMQDLVVSALLVE